MAFAAARMIMPKDKQGRKTSADLPGSNKNRGKQLNLRQSRSPSLVSARSGLSHDSFKNKQGPPPHPYVPRSASGRPGGKPPTSRGCVKRTKGKGKKGKKGCRDTYDLIVNIDLTEWQLTDEQVAEFKEVFMLFDKDEDGVLTFPELNVVMKSLGQRPSENELLTMVRDVSEDHIYDTIEFNEFLQMMSKQQKFGMTEDSLKDAFRIFDKDDDGFISVDELRHIMQSLGEKMKDSELDEMIAEADSDNDGLINYEEFVQVLCNDGKSKGAKKKKKHRKKETATATAAAATTSTTVVVVEKNVEKENRKHEKRSSSAARAPTATAPTPQATIPNSQSMKVISSAALSASKSSAPPPAVTSPLSVLPPALAATPPNALPHNSVTPAKLPPALPNKSKSVSMEKSMPTTSLASPKPVPPAPNSTPKTSTLKNGTPASMTKSKADIIVIEKSKSNKGLSTVKDNGRKK